MSIFCSEKIDCTGFLINLNIYIIIVIKNGKIKMEVSLVRVLFAAGLEFPMILVPRLPLSGKKLKL